MENERKLTNEEFDTLAYRELKRLDGEFKRMLHDRDTSKKQATAILANQCKVIEALEYEKAELQNLVDNSKVNARKNAVTVIELKKIIKKYEEYETKNAETKSEMANVRFKINEINKSTTLQQRSHQAQSVDPLKKEEKEIEHLENMSQAEACMLSQILTENRKLGEEANNLLIIKLKHNQMYEKLLVALGRGKKELFNFLEQTTEAYEKNRTVGFKSETLEEEAEKDFKLHMNEFRNHNIFLRYNEELNNFLLIKAKIRSNDYYDGEQENSLKRKGNALQEKLRFYREILDDITGGLEEQNIDNVLNSFVRIEEDNFNIYSFLNDQNMRIHQINSEVELLEKEINDHNAVNEKKRIEMVSKFATVDEYYKELLSTLEEKKSSLENFEVDFHSILEGVGQLFNFSICDWSQVAQILGTKETVTPYNVHLFLRTIEKRLQLLSSIRNKGRPRGTQVIGSSVRDSGTAKTSDRLKGDSPMATPCPYCAESLDSSDTTEIVLPMDSDEIKASVLSDIKRGRWRLITHNVSECPLPHVQKPMDTIMTPT